MPTDPNAPLAVAINRGFNAADLDAAIRSAVRAVIPGRQQKKNLAPLLLDARKAFVRTLRRRTRS